MNRWKLLVLGMLFSLMAISCTTVTVTHRTEDLSVLQWHEAELPLIPKPVSQMAADGRYQINSKMTVAFPELNGDSERIASWLKREMKTRFGVDVALKEDKTGDVDVDLAFVLLPDTPNGSSEQYGLHVLPSGAVIRGFSGRGWFYGVQTLMQLMEQQSEAVMVPHVKISDSPRYPWRGMHLDVCRHFFPADSVKKFIDLLALHKMNRFHWHLTEDQGWRIEIKKYPKLTEVGAWCVHEDGTTSGGFYTQEEVRDIVAYASDRFITIVPEIEMPGHASAALTAYPDLSCTGGPHKVGENWGIFEDVFCAGKEETFEFLENVLDEVVDLFPSVYVHIGGDECPKTRWEEHDLCQKRIEDEGLANEHELQSYFIRRIEKHLQSRGRKLIGWDEILEGGLAPEATVMSWRGISGGIAAVEQGHDVIMTPTSHCYFDYYQAEEGEPKAFGSSFLPLEQVYTFDPIPEEFRNDARFSRHVLGGQGNIWTEQIPNWPHVEYMALPRMTAMAEVLWSPREGRSYDDFTKRLGLFTRFLDYYGANYRIPTPEGFDLYNAALSDKTVVELRNPIHIGEIHYTLDGTDPTIDSPRYTKPLEIGLENGKVELRVRTFLSTTRMSPVKRGFFEKQVLRPAKVIVGPLRTGLDYELVTGNFGTVKDVLEGEAERRGRMAAFMLPSSRPENHFGVRYSGLIRVPEDGLYTFWTKSDDGSCLWINDELVVDNDGLHGPRFRKGIIALSKGLHAIRCAMFESGGGEMLEVYVQQSDHNRKELESSQLFSE